MEKIIESLIKDLTSQRESLIYSIENLDESNSNFFNKQQIIENAIANIDTQIENHLNKLNNG